MSRFDEFWAAYPKKEGKAPARKKWDLMKLDQQADAIIMHVKARTTADKKWLDGYIPMPTTFINQQRWLDEYESVKPKQEHDRPPVSPYTLSEGVAGMARFYRIDTDKLTEDDVCRIVWAIRHKDIHRDQLSDDLLKVVQVMENIW